MVGHVLIDDFNLENHDFVLTFIQSWQNSVFWVVFTFQAEK